MADVHAGDPQAIVRLVAAKEVRKVQASIEARYGFKPTAAYVADLIAFVDTMALVGYVDSVVEQMCDEQPGT